MLSIITKTAMKFLLTLLSFFALQLGAQPKPKAFFKVVPLGIKGGSDESNLSAYMIAPSGTNNYVCLDAGTVRYGIEKAITNQVFKADATTVLKHYIKGYLISHAHLDHVAGLIINSPDDTAKSIYALPFVLNTLRDKYFTWQNWANFANEGDKPTLNKYRYIVLKEDSIIPVGHTGMNVKTFSLSHSNPYESTAFLLSSRGNFILYLGDTGADSIEKSDKLSKVWQYIAPLIKSGNLKAIFIEVSFPDEQPEKQLFGHLTPILMMKEMKALSMLSGETALRNVNVVITHLKPYQKNEAKIKRQLSAQNSLRLKLLYPVQGRLLQF
jgi:3',5'-cyclic-nucleotide phosphodiesterase